MKAASPVRVDVVIVSCLPPISAARYYKRTHAVASDVGVIPTWPKSTSNDEDWKPEIASPILAVISIRNLCRASQRNPFKGPQAPNSTSSSWRKRLAQCFSFHPQV